MMAFERAFAWAKSHRWWLALIVVIIAGYSIGKDMAIRDNLRDTSASTGDA